MPELKIDNRTVEVPEGATLLDAARQAGVDVPTLCHVEGFPASSSCMVCVVKVGGRLVPSCATRAVEGMEVESETGEVHHARKMALELLLSDHLGDCVAPCQRICPLGINVPSLARHVAEKDLRDAMVELRRGSPLPAVLARVCSANCESGCRRHHDGSGVSVRNLELHVTEHARSTGDPCLPEPLAASGRKVAVIGAGPTGLSAAYFLRLRGHECVVFDRSDAAGGSLLESFSEEELPREVVAAEVDLLCRLGVTLRLGAEGEVGGAGPSLDVLREEYDAVLVAAGPEARALDVPATATGLTVDATTFETETPGVYAAGDAVKAEKRVVRKMADGKAAATCIDQAITGRTVSGPPGCFSCRLGRLVDGEMDRFLQLANAGERKTSPTGVAGELTDEQAVEEATRCLHCDCRKASDCRLRIYAQRYGADAGRFRSERRTFEQRVDHPFVIFEPAKCILCGVCIEVAREEKQALGLTYIGRGFDVRVGIPFDAPLSDALRETARRAIALCPTGAIASREEGGGACGCTSLEADGATEDAGRGTGTEADAAAAAADAGASPAGAGATDPVS